MDDKEFRELAQKMRKAQVDYFTGGRTHGQLMDAKRLEKLVDEELKRVAPDGPAEIPEAVQENLFVEDGNDEEQ